MATIDNRSQSVNPFGLVRNRLSPLLWAAAVTSVVALPWLAPGYLFGTDWPGPRFIRWPTQLSSAAPFDAVLAITSTILSAELAAKILVLASLFVAAWGAFAALPTGDFVPRASASLIYALNPFVYGRLHYGQLYLVAAYAVLPWVALRIFRLLVAPTFAKSLLVAVGLAVIGMLAVHLLLPGLLLLGLASLCAVAFLHYDRGYVARLGVNLGISTLATLLLSSYWLIPYLAGNSYESQVIPRIGTGDLAAYGTVGDPSFGLAGNLLGLYGFWAEAVHRFPSMKLFVPGWALVVLVMLVLALIGAVTVFVVRNEALRALRWWIVALVLTGVVGLLLEAGVADPRIAPFIRWLDAAFPPYRGMRDSGKWASIVALVYAQLIPLGFIGIRKWLKATLDSPGLREGTRSIAAGIALALPLYYGNGLLFGMHGQIQPSQYPSGWYVADRIMADHGAKDRALFLPWHLYLRLSFVHNVNSVIANPAPRFFSIATVVSGDPEVAGIPPPDSADQKTLQALLNAGASGDWGPVLKSRRIKFVIVAKELDWQVYQYLGARPDLVRVADTASLVLYRVTDSP